MGRKSSHGQRLSRFLGQRAGWLPVRRWPTSALAVAALASLTAVPTSAAELEAWHYDSQTRSLTLVLPASVVPSVSVVAPDRLLLELPDTQVGERRGQTVEDGVVESIVLQQATPETVWMTVEFAPGTVLASAQSATPLEDGGDRSAQSGNPPDNLQQWQVRPAVVASRRTAEPGAIAPADLPPTAGSSADNLRLEPLPAGRSAAATGPVELAQTADFPDLPILEPAMPLEEPVSVPSLPARPAEVPATEEKPEIDETAEAVAAPPATPLPTQSAPVEAVVEVPVVDAPIADETEAVPLDPPFIGEVQVVDEPAELADEPPVALSQPASEVLPDVEAGSDLPAAAPEDSRTAAATAAVPLDAPGPAADEVPGDRNLETNRPSRWPDPIPFGQPLP